MFQRGQGNKNTQAWCSSEYLVGTACLTRAVRGSMSIGRKYQLFIIQLLICAFIYFPEQTLSMLPPQTLNTHVIHQTLIFLLSLHQMRSLYIWVSFIRPPPNSSWHQTYVYLLFSFCFAFHRSFLFLYTHVIFFKLPYLFPLIQKYLRKIFLLTFYPFLSFLCPLYVYIYIY